MTQYQVIDLGNIWNNYKRNINNKIYDTVKTQKISDLKFFCDVNIENFDKKLF